MNNPQLKDRAEIIKDKGTNRQKFLKGIVDKYTWQDKGSSYLLGELPAAYLYAQLLEIEKISKTRKEIFDSYYEQLTMLATSAHLQLPQKNAFNNYNGHIFYIILKTEDERDRLMQFLKDQSISAVPHYVALHNSVAGLRLGRSVGTMNLTDDLSKRLLRLPLFYGLSLQNVERITESIKAFWK